jgi:enoyl-CoA hydratase
MSEPELLTTGPVDGVATLTMNRPAKRNALSISLRDAVGDALTVLAGDDALRTLIITGAGPVFSAGFDLGELEAAATDADLSETLWASSDRYHQAMLDFPFPIVAAVNGPALAGGFDLAVMCDIRVAADTARFAHPEIRFGDVVYGPLHDLVGGAVARDLCLTGRSVDAAEAFRLHLVSRVVPLPELSAAATETATSIASAPRDVLIRTKAKARRRAGTAPGPTLDL